MTATDGIDLYGAAKQYINAFGDQADLPAVMHSDALLAAGHLDGTANWQNTHKGDRKSKVARVR